MDMNSLTGASCAPLPLDLNPEHFNLRASGVRFDGAPHTACHPYRVRALDGRLFVVESVSAFPVPTLVVTDGSRPADTVVSHPDLPVPVLLADVRTVHADVTAPGEALRVAWPLLNEWFRSACHLHDSHEAMLAARTHRTTAFLRAQVARWARADVTVDHVEAHGELYIETGRAGASAYRVTQFKAAASLIVDGIRMLSGTVQADGSLTLSMDLACVS